MDAVLRDRLQYALGTTYEIERELGGAGMSRVFAARETKLGRSVVLKVLAPDIAGAINVERFTREIQVLARLQHPHIVPLLSAGEADGVPYYAMPMVEGETLRSRLSREGKLPAEEATRVASEVADALAYAHDRGVVHRDIKPANILLSGGHALVVDFGIAKALDASLRSSSDSSTQAGLTLGTPLYMSPEQAAGEADIDQRSDVYSLGAVLYEMLSGRPPFEGPNAAVVLAKRFVETPAPLRTLDASIPSHLESTAERAMAADPEARFQTAGDFVAALRQDHVGRQRAAVSTAPVGAAAVSAAPVSTAPVSAAPVSAAPVSLAAPERSIAVLPFANMSAEPESDYFSEGMTDEIINALTQLPGVRVAARTSSFSFKGKDVDIAEVGAKLRVATVLEGSVRRAGKRLRIAVQLINAADGLHLWSDRYDRDLEDVFAIQDEIARAIAAQLQVRLTSLGRAPVARQATANLDAYDLYLKGRYFEVRRGPQMRSAVEHFNRATKADPNFALAYAGLADSYSALAFHGYMRSAEAFEPARGAARRALALDDEIAESHYAVGLVEYWMGWDWRTCERELLRASEIHPSWSMPVGRLSQLYSHLGRSADARTAASRAADLDPLSPLMAILTSVTFVMESAADEAVVLAERALELDPNFAPGYWALGAARMLNDRMEEAVTSFERAVVLSTRSPLTLGLAGAAYAESGRESDARAVAAELEQLGARPDALALVHWALGDEERALTLLEKAASEHTAGFFELPLYGGLAARNRLKLAADARWHALLRRVGLDALARTYARLGGKTPP